MLTVCELDSIRLFGIHKFCELEASLKKIHTYSQKNKTLRALIICIRFGIVLVLDLSRLFFFRCRYGCQGCRPPTHSRTSRKALTHSVFPPKNRHSSEKDTRPPRPEDHSHYFCPQKSTRPLPVARQKKQKIYCHGTCLRIATW